MADTSQHADTPWHSPLAQSLTSSIHPSRRSLICLDCRALPMKLRAAPAFYFQQNQSSRQEKADAASSSYETTSCYLSPARGD